ELMETAAPAGSGKMVAVMNADLAVIEQVCEEASLHGIVCPANYNTPAQIVIGGEVAAVEAAIVLLKDAGVKRIIELNVSGPFHTPLLAPASQALAEVLERVPFADFQIPLVGNTEAQVMGQDQIRSLLARQVMEPVRFYESVAKLQEIGATRFIEIGPG
ncbi:ACP S-malonyltransferase, partial [Enterococcus faecalis]|nr:ACP S-malonyltransferase [Enterococcus faecalis]